MLLVDAMVLGRRRETMNGSVFRINLRIATMQLYLQSIFALEV